MQFTKIPLSGDSVYDDLVYSFETETSQTVIVKIIDQNSFKTIATKRFVNITTADIDVAPYIRAMTKYIPRGGRTGFYTPIYRFFAIVVDVNGVKSSPRMFTTTQKADGAALISTMPLSRCITYGESDQITISPPSPITVTVIAQSEGVTIAENYQQYLGGLEIFRLNTLDFVNATHITVSLGNIADIEYTIIAQPKSARRLAWISSKGSTEHYTFPIEKEMNIDVKREKTLSGNGEKESYSVSKEGTTTLLSAYEPTKVIDALAEILHSNYAWEVVGDEYRSIDIVETRSSVKRYGTLCNVEVVLSSSEKIKL